ncbi:carboxypeptidase-like regulatory domain-containing protein [Flavobacterium sp. N3904]|uniref:carboxypeptidase-like regulatory domain-containing protein n=1 Tax=Flavobacterium sp. N3904 TaxID=2986835 RepID=UPI0022249CCA|nr:carboxypeptidase-like regulatory domain-containing protein [Flavobacterium sp. N3904]
MKPHHLFLSIALLASACIFGQATNIRGQVINQQKVPLVSANVDLYVYDGAKPVGNQWVLRNSTITDSYGFYFFNAVPVGSYTVWVNKSRSYNITVTVIAKNLSYQDVPQFIF